MNLKTLIAISVFAIVMVAVLVLAPFDNGDDGPKPLFPIINADPVNQINQVKQIEIRAPGSDALHLERGADKAWNVVESDHYPADVAKIRNALVALSEAVVLEPKTSDAEEYAGLGLAPPDAEEGAGTRLKFSSDDREWEIILGDVSKQLSESQFVRVPQQGGVTWLINRRLSLSGEAGEWLDQQIVHVEPSNLHRIRIERTGREPVAIIREKPGDELQLAELSEDREPKDVYRLNQIAAAVDFLSFTEVFVKDESFTLPEGATTGTFTTFDGLVLTLAAYKIDDLSYAVVDSAYDDEISAQYAMEETGADSGPGWSKGKVDALSQHLSKWYFRVRNSTYDALDVSLDDLSSVKEQPEEAETPAAEEEASGEESPGGAPLEEGSPEDAMPEDESYGKDSDGEELVPK